VGFCQIGYVNIIPYAGPIRRITQILNGKRGVSVETALRLSRYFGNSAQFWMNLQARYELAVAEREMGPKINSEVQQAA